MSWASSFEKDEQSTKTRLSYYPNPDNLSWIFQRETGMGYQQWRQQWRLMRAIELLASGRSLGYCAFELDFASDSTFIAFFKHMTGSTPRTYLG